MSNKRKHKSNTLGFRKMHYKYMSGIKSTFVKTKMRIIKENINQILWGFGMKHYKCVSGIKSTFVGTNKKN